MEELNTFTWGSLLALLAQVGMKLLGGLLILFVGLFIVRRIKKALGKAKFWQKMEPSIAGFVLNAIIFLLYAVVILSAAGVFGVPLTIFVTILSLIGAAISLAVQGALSNFIGGIIILVLKPFRVGNYIKVGDTDGTVRAIGMYYTTLVTPDGKEISLPNSNLTGTAIVNFSKEEKRRIDMDFSLSYGSDIDAVKQTLLDMAMSNELTLRDPEPQVLIQAFEDSAVIYRLRLYVKNADYWKLYYYLTEEGKRCLDKAGLEIPFPQVDVHMKDQ